MLKKSPKTGKYYAVDSLTLEEKIRLGFDKDAVKEVKSIPEEKKSPAKEQKEGKKKRVKKDG